MAHGKGLGVVVLGPLVLKLDDPPLGVEGQAHGLYVSPAEHGPLEGEAPGVEAPAQEGSPAGLPVDFPGPGRMVGQVDPARLVPGGPVVDG